MRNLYPCEILSMDESRTPTLVHSKYYSVLEWILKIAQTFPLKSLPHFCAIVFCIQSEQLTFALFL